MDLSEKALRFQEDHIPELAEGAVKQAYWRALAAGSSVLESKDGFLIEVQPDGTQKIIKKLRPPVKIPLGLRIEIR